MHLGHTYTTESYSAIKEDEMMPLPTAWMRAMLTLSYAALEIVKPSRGSQRKTNTTWRHPHVEPKWTYDTDAHIELKWHK